MEPTKEQIETAAKAYARYTGNGLPPSLNWLYAWREVLGPTLEASNSCECEHTASKWEDVFISKYEHHLTSPMERRVNNIAEAINHIGRALAKEGRVFK